MASDQIRIDLQEFEEPLDPQYLFSPGNGVSAGCQVVQVQLASFILDLRVQQAVTDGIIRDRKGPQVGEGVEGLARLLLLQEVLLQDAPGRLHRRAREHGRFEVIAKGRSVAVFAPRLGIELENQGNHEGENQEGEKEGYATFIRPSHRSQFSAWRLD